MTIKDIAKAFLNKVVDGEIDSAYMNYVNMKGKHHNPFFPNDFESLKQGMKDNHVEMPNKSIQFLNCITEDDKVMVQSRLNLNEKDSMNTVHIFRFENNKIVELWDVAQSLP